MARQIHEYHPVIAFRFIPGIKARIPHEGGGYLIRVNNMGFRCDHDFVPNKRAGVRRVLLFGDSFTAGEGVSNGKRYGDLLEQKIHDLEVYNFGLPATGTDQHYLAYREYAQGIEHDLLVISVFVENIRRVVAHYRLFLNEKGEDAYYVKPYFELVDGSLELKNIPPSKEPVYITDIPEDERKAIDRGGRFYTLRKIATKTGIKKLAQKLSHYQPLPEYNNPDSPAWQLMAAILEDWIRKSPKPVLLTLIPLYQYIEETSDPSQCQARFQELAARLGCAFHNPLADLQSYSLVQRRMFRFQKDQHLTKEGHEALAESLVPVVTRLMEGGDNE
jgi:carbamoyltransferase